MSSCANVSYHISSVANLTQEPIFNPEETYTYYDKVVSNILAFDEFEIMVMPDNSVKTNGHFELFFVPIKQQGSSIGSVRKTPFQISVSVKEEKNGIKFLPFKSKLNSDLVVQLVKWRGQTPSCNDSDWTSLELNSLHITEDRLRNQEEKCMKSGWVEYLLVFDSKTPNPTARFSLELWFQSIKTNELINKKLFFSAAKFVSTQRH